MGIANPDAELDLGSTAFMFLAMALVQFMGPGLAFFYGGLVRTTSVVAVMIQTFGAMVLLYVLWFAVLFSLSFGQSIYGLIGSPLTYPFFADVSVHGPLMRDGEVLYPGVPGVLTASYLGMFAVITPALITGAFTDRFRFKPYLYFILWWSILVYAPVCHWIWGGGWLQALGVQDFAGGIVVHTTAGFSALATLLVVGKRQVHLGIAKEVLSTPHNIPFVALGTGILWFGWFGFNGGSAYGSGGLAAVAAANSQIAAAFAGTAWLLTSWWLNGKPGLVGVCVGAISGLATVTPAAGFIQPQAAAAFGIVGCFVGYFCIFCANWLDFDDALDVWAVHGMGGMAGSILLGALADPKECADKKSAPDFCVNAGTATRSGDAVIIQTFAALFVALYSFGVCYILTKLLSCFMELVPPMQTAHLDDEEHGETAYSNVPTPVQDTRDVEALSASAGPATSSGRGHPMFGDPLLRLEHAPVRPPSPPQVTLATAPQSPSPEPVLVRRGHPMFASAGGYMRM